VSPNFALRAIGAQTLTAPPKTAITSPRQDLTSLKYTRSPSEGPTSDGVKVASLTVSTSCTASNGGGLVSMEEILSNPLFRYAAFPIGSALLGVYVKYVTRNDQYAKFRKEDLAVGLELILTALLLFVAATTDQAIALRTRNQELAAVIASQPSDLTQIAKLQTETQAISQRLGRSGWTVLGFIFLLWGGSTLVRKWGWRSSDDLHPVRGIAMPLAAGILALFAAMAGLGL
jgi:hypothetical protein